MTEILKTQNKTWGFWGTASNHIEHKQEMQAFWDKAAEIIQSKGLSEVSLGKRPDPAKRSLGLPSLCACRCGNLWS